MSLLEFENDGPLLLKTNYWDSEHASAGLCYLSANAGTLRLLVPEAAEGLLAEMKTGRSVTIEKGILNAQCIDVVFEDGTSSPFSLSIDKRQVDRKLEKGKLVPFVVWTRRGIEFSLSAKVKV